MKQLLCAVLLVGGCGGNAGKVCGKGTHAVNGTCVPDPPGIVCAMGTHADGGECVPDDQCGAGTHNNGGKCVPNDQCGPGTHDSGGTCVPNDQCGPGTHDDGNGKCVPNSGAVYEVRVGVQKIDADGYSKIPVFVIGTNADGTPATDKVVLVPSVSYAATLEPAVVKLTPTGATTYLTPCNSAAIPTCLGDFVINLALASAPGTVVAKSPTLTLVAPSGVGSTAACLGGGNVIFYDGNDWVYNGTETISQGAWSISGSTSDITVHVTPSSSSQGYWWDLEFSSRELNQPLMAQVYNNAERAPFASPGHPGIDIGGDGRGCNTITGRFQIEDLTMSGSTIQSFTATFEQHCEGGQAVLRGCVHFEQ
jgi:hypothetical protein